MKKFLILLLLIPSLAFAGGSMRGKSSTSKKPKTGRQMTHATQSFYCRYQTKVVTTTTFWNDGSTSVRTREYHGNQFCKTYGKNFRIWQ